MHRLFYTERIHATSIAFGITEIITSEYWPAIRRLQSCFRPQPEEKA